jgi:hypothetical protein
LVPLSTLSSGLLDPTTNPLDEFLAAVDQQSFSDDPFDPRNRSKDELVVEGQVCTP